MPAKIANTHRTQALSRLATLPAVPRLTEAALAVMANRKLIRKAMRMGHRLDALSVSLQIPKRTLQRHLNEAGLFFRKPRSKTGTVVRPKKSAVLRGKTAAIANVS
jgi:hypothetical protein